jgi:hypothetical protein
MLGEQLRPFALGALVALAGVLVGRAAGLTPETELGTAVILAILAVALGVSPGVLGRPRLSREPDADRPD